MVSRIRRVLIVLMAITAIAYVAILLIDGSLTPPRLAQ